MESSSACIPPHHLDHDAALHADLRAPSTPYKRRSSQSHRYHSFRTPNLSPGLLSQPYHRFQPRTKISWLSSTSLTHDALITHPDTRIATWTKKDMYREAKKPESFWPKRPPHHYGRCRGCHGYWPHNKKGSRTRGRLGRETVEEGVREWREGWRLGDDWSCCGVCDERAYWYYGNGVAWGGGGRPVILGRIDTEGLAGGMGRGSGSSISNDGEDWDMLDSGSDGRSSTSGGWEVLDDEFEGEMKIG